MRKIKFFKAVVNNQRGEGYVDFLIKILITVIIGSLLLGLMKVAIPGIFNDVIDKIKSVFTI